MKGIKFRLRAGARLISVADYRRRAQRALPDMIWSYVENGADDEITLQRNRSGFDRWEFLPRVLTGKAPTDLGVDIAGVHLDIPVLLAPTGMTGLVHASGEQGAAVGAERAGTRAIISTSASYSIEEVNAASQYPHLFQLYPWSDPASGARALTESFIDRAARADAPALVLTVDVPVRGNREGERKRGMGIPPVLTPLRMLDAAWRPRWWLGFLRHGRVSARMLVDQGGTRAAVASAEVQTRLTVPNLDWTDFEWIRERWEGPLLIKGVLTAADAERAVALGADGIIVSNHGGRQLDGAPASVDALPDIAEAVGGRAQVILDSGIRRGTDVVKALCLGADAVCIGRAYLYGLAVGGSTGVTGVLDVLRQEMVTAMTLLGVGDLKELDRSLVRKTASI